MFSGQENDARLHSTSKPVFDASSNIVVWLCRIIPFDQNFPVYFDIYYTTLGLLIYLKNNGILSLGTVRRNRLKI